MIELGTQINPNITSAGTIKIGSASNTGLLINPSSAHMATGVINNSIALNNGVVARTNPLAINGSLTIAKPQNHLAAVGRSTGLAIDTINNLDVSTGAYIVHANAQPHIGTVNPLHLTAGVANPMLTVQPAHTNSAMALATVNPSAYTNNGLTVDSVNRLNHGTATIVQPLAVGTITAVPVKAYPIDLTPHVNSVSVAKAEVIAIEETNSKSNESSISSIYFLTYIFTNPIFLGITTIVYATSVFIAFNGNIIFDSIIHFGLNNTLNNGLVNLINLHCNNCFNNIKFEFYFNLFGITL